MDIHNIRQLRTYKKPIWFGIRHKFVRATFLNIDRTEGFLPEGEADDLSVLAQTFGFLEASWQHRGMEVQNFVNLKGLRDAWYEFSPTPSKGFLKFDDLGGQAAALQIHASKEGFEEILAAAGLYYEGTEKIDDSVRYKKYPE